MEGDPLASDHEAEKQEGHLTRRRQGPQDQLQRLSEQGSPNPKQPIPGDKNTEVLMNINENMGQMASLPATLCRRLPQTADGRPPDKNRQPSGTGVSSETQHSVESDSNESSTSDEGDRSFKRNLTHEWDHMSVHAIGDESVDVKLFTRPQSQQVTNQQQVDNAVLKELSDLLDED